MATVPHMSAIDVDDEVVLLAPEEETVPEDDLHRILVDLMAAGLVRRFAAAPDVAVFSRLAWFPDRDNTRIRLDPDVMVVRGRPPGRRRSYKAWVEDGVAPAVIVEVWSEEDTDADYRRRLERARRYGVEEVVFVVPFAPGGVRVEHLAADPDDPSRFRSTGTSTRSDQPLTIESLGIVMTGGRELVVQDDGQRWPTTAEAFQQARDQAARADHEAARADQEAARAERLRAQLRAAGIDPDA